MLLLRLLLLKRVLLRRNRLCLLRHGRRCCSHSRDPAGVPRAAGELRQQQRSVVARCARRERASPPRPSDAAHP